MLTVHLLGGFEVAVKGAPLDLRSRPAQLLLAYLALHRGKAVPREKVAGVLWPDSPESTARNNLRRALWQLRKVLPKGCLESDKRRVTFDPGGRARVDVAELERDPGASPSVESLVAAVEAYSGELLPGFYEDWVALERERLRALYEERMAALLEALAEAGRWRELREWSERWLAQGETPEPAYRGLMLAAASLGDAAALAAAYRRCEAELEAALGVQPSEETTALYQRLAAGERPGASGPRWKVAEPLTPIIGREQELAELERLLLEEDQRIITILGLGGIGKTRLAVELALRVQDRLAEGAAFVDLAPVKSPEHVPSAIASALAFTLSDERAEPEAQLAAFLEGKSLLLLLDNFEHLLPAAPLVGRLLEVEPGLRVVVTSRERLNLHAELLYEVQGLALPETEAQADAPAVRLFMEQARKSRSGFRAEGEERKAVLEICRLLQGMPLGIELAAALVPVLSCQEIAEELQRDLDILSTTMQDLPPRLRSLRATFEHSWRLMTEEERAVFRALSVFRGGFTREAAKEVVGASVPSLLALVNKSLLRRTAEGRFQVHELLRQFGEEELMATPGEERAVRDRHSAYYLSLLSENEKHLEGGERQAEVLRALRDDLGNLWAAWDWACREARLEDLDRAADPLSHFCHIAGLRVEGKRLMALGVEVLEGHLAEALASDRAGLEASLGRMVTRRGLLRLLTGESEAALEDLTRGLRLATAAGDAREEAVALCWLGYAHYRRSAFAEGEACVRRGLERIEGLDGGRLEALLWNNLANLLVAQGRSEEALDAYRRCLVYTQTSGNRTGEATVLLNMALAARGLGDVRSAREWSARGLALCQEVGESPTLGFALWHLAQDRMVLGDYPGAEEAYHRSIAVFRDFGDRWGVGIGFVNLADLDVIWGREAQAEEHLQEALEALGQVQSRWGIAHVHQARGDLLLLQEDLDAAAEAYAESLALGQEARDPWREASIGNALARVALDRGDLQAARDYLDRAKGAGQKIGDRQSLLASRCLAAELALAEEDVEGALQEAQRSVQDALAMGAQLPLLECLFAAALVARRHGQGEWAEEALQTILDHPASSELLRRRAAKTLGMTATPPRPSPDNPPEVEGLCHAFLSLTKRAGHTRRPA